MQHQQPIYIVQQQTQAQPIRLANPTKFHLEQTRIRQEQEREYGAPPTPNNSFNNNPIGFANNNNMSSILPYAVKQESDIGNNDVMSPMSNPSSYGSPHQNNGLDTDGIRFEDGIDVDQQLFFGDFSTSAPVMSTITMNTNDFKTIPATNRPHNNNGFQNQAIPVSASVPTWTSGFDANMANSFPQTTRQAVQFSPEVQVYDQEYNTQEFVSNNEEGETFEKSQMVMEKKRRRRESHNAVERRRRDNINEKIQELSTLLPERYTESANKPNKGMILKKSVIYIRDLREKYNNVEARNQELEQMIRDLKNKLDVGPSGDLLSDG